MRPRPGLRAADVKISWSLRLPDSTLLTDRTNASLLKACQQFIDALMHDPPPGIRPRGPSTAVNHWMHLRLLIRWMYTNGIKKFSELDASSMSDFLEMIASGMYRASKKKPTRMFVAKCAHTCQCLYVFRHKMRDGMTDDCLKGGAPVEYINSGVEVVGWKPVPDELAIKLISGALRLIYEPADDILRMRRKYGAVMDRYAGLTKRRRYKKAIRALADESFSTISGESRPWREGSVKVQDLAMLTRRIVEASFVVVTYLVGTRVSEVVGMGPGSVTRRRHSDGEYVSYINGELGKSGHKRHRWVATDAVRRAIYVVAKITEPYRKKARIQNYWITMPGNGFWPHSMSRKNVCSINSSEMCKRLDILAKFLGANEYQGKQWHYVTHHGRKTFASFVTRRNKRSLGALMQQYGHISDLITDKFYAGRDYDLEQLVDEEQRRDLRACLEDLLQADAFAGRSASTFRDRSALRFRGKTVVLAEVDRMIAAGVMLGGCHWGYCVYRPDTSACKGSVKGPNPVNRTPSVCKNCVNFVATEKHASFWEGRKGINLKILHQPGVPSQTRAVLKARIQECDEILAELKRSTGGSDDEGDA